MCSIIATPALSLGTGTYLVDCDQHTLSRSLLHVLPVPRFPQHLEPVLIVFPSSCRTIVLLHLLPRTHHFLFSGDVITLGTGNCFS